MLVNRLLDWLAVRVIVLLIDRTLDCLIDGLIGCLVGCLIDGFGCLSVRLSCLNE